MFKLLYFIKSENCYKLVKDGKILNCFYKCLLCGCWIKMFVLENLLFLEVGLFFFICIVCIYCFFIENVFRMNWLLFVNMEIMFGVFNIFRLEILRIGEFVFWEDYSVVCRNLMNFFLWCECYWNIIISKYFLLCGFYISELKYWKWEIICV